MGSRFSNEVVEDLVEMKAAQDVAQKKMMTR